MNQEPLALAAELRQPLPEGQREQLSRELTEAGTAHIFLTAKPVLSRYAQAPTHLRSNPLLVRMGPSVGAESSTARIEDVTQLFERYDQSVRLERLYVAKEARPAFRERLALLPSDG